MTQQYQQQFTSERVRFLRRLDHEIKNPLMGIKTALDNLAETTNPQKRLQIRGVINEQIDRLTRLVADLRKIGDMQYHEIERLPVDVAMLLDDAFSIACDEEHCQDRELQLIKLNYLPVICGDYDLLLLAIHNILNNALKYTQKNNWVRLSASSEDGQVIITIADNGPGIDAKDLPFVWDELYRSEQVKGIEGSGIGLAMVRQIIERHGGYTKIRSSVEEGTTVYLYLPID